MVDLITCLVMTVTGGRSWDENSQASICLTDGRLIVNQTPSVHREIRALLGRLGAFR